ncbi:zinc finger protein 318 isoform X3 [Monodelphis domestica]|uniref:zinc finger protein 318 isoform X3 n=1 Tax=Monodelphis domestica TaxID=13616 RepID=UPI000443558D|nr:zinc finger protein 318 isoform X3 [Monodelphis domestica]
MYRSSGRSSVSSHRPKESGGVGVGGGGSRNSRSAGSSSSSTGPVRRASPPPVSSSSSASSRPPCRRPRSPSGHRGRHSPSPPPHSVRGRRRGSPSPPWSRRGSPSPPRGRRGSPSPPRSRRASPSPTRPRRLFPSGSGGFRGSSRSCSRSDFARDGRGDHPGDSGSRRRSPGLRSESSVEQSLRITVGNDRFCLGSPDPRRLNDRLGSPVDNLGDIDRDDLADGPIFTHSSQCSRGLERYTTREEGPLSPFLGRLDEDYRTREAFLHRSDYNPHVSRHDDLLRDRDKLKVSYSVRSEERSREAKRSRYDDSEKIHSLGGDHPNYASGARNYRQRRHSPSSRFMDPEFRELDLARRKREEEEERNRSMGQDLVGVDSSSSSSCTISGVSGSEPGYTVHRPEDVPMMPKKSILKKRVEVVVEPSLQMESFSSSTNSSQELPLISGHPSLPPSSATVPFASEVENNKGALTETALKEPQESYQWGPLSGLPKDTSPLREKFGSFLSHKEKIDGKVESGERHTDFLLPHERASQDGSGFSRILGMLAEPTSAQEKRRRSFPDIEDEEKFLYGNEEEDLKPEFPPKSLGGLGSEARRERANSSPSPSSALKLEGRDETNPEYAKIHNLLKTIGLDIGVAEISKLAVRTQERLHGKKFPSHSSLDRRSVDRRSLSDRSSSDSHRLESREARRSDTRSPEMSRPHMASPVDPYLRAKNSPPFLKSDHSMSQIPGPEVANSGPRASAIRCLIPSAPAPPIRLPHCTSSVTQFQIPTNTQFSAAQIPPDYQTPPIPPSTYDAYRHYMAYAVSAWPMYPSPQQPSHPLTDPHRLIPVTKQVTPSRPNLRVIPTIPPAESKREESMLVPIPVINNSNKVPVRLPIPPLMRYNPEKISDEKNRASQKQKVIEEREKLRSDRDARQKKMYYLRTELDRLHKQQGEMLRKKRREKDGHKDPLLVEESKSNNEKSHAKSPKPTDTSSQPLAKQSSQLATVYEYYDAGNHWCRDCNTICGTMFDFFTHMHKKKHRQTLDPYNRPWASKIQSEAKQDNTKRADKITVPAKGSEFLIPITGYYCQLCEEFFGDPISGEQHVKCHQHNEKYKKYVDENPLYEERRNLDRQAGLAVVLETERRRQNELKRKLSEKPKEETDEKKAKVVKETKEDEEKLSEELDEQLSETWNSPDKLENKRKMIIKLQLKEETKEPQTSSSFGKFSWKKSEKDDEKTSGVAPSIPKEESIETNKDKEDGKAQAGKVKPIEIKLSGKTVIAHTSPWMPVVATSTQAKIRPNLPIPTTVLRKSGSATVSKPAPLNTFLSIKSSGATTKPLPVVKESSTDLLLPPDIISKAFGGEEVILKSSPEEKTVVAEKNEPAPIPEQLLPPPPPPPPPPPLPVTPKSASTPPAQTTTVLSPVKSTPTLSQILTPGIGGSNLLTPVLPSSILAPVHPTAIPSDEVAPGVSESDHDQALLSVLVRPPPPLSGVFSEQAKKLEKRNSCLATANAKDLYDIFYSSGGKGNPESKLGNSTLSNGESSNYSKNENSDSSSSPKESGIFLRGMSQDKGLTSVPLDSCLAKSNAKTMESPKQQTIVEQNLGLKSRGCLQPLTGTDFGTTSLADDQVKPQEEVNPEASASTMFSSSSYESETNRDIRLEGEADLNSGEPGPPGVEEPAPQMSDILCPANLVDTKDLGIVDSQAKRISDPYLAEEHCADEAEAATELEDGRLLLSEGVGKERIGDQVEELQTLSSIVPKDSKEDSHAWKKEAKQTKLLGEVMTEPCIQALSALEIKTDSKQTPDTRFISQTPQSIGVQHCAEESSFQSILKRNIYLTSCPQVQAVLASFEDCQEDQSPEPTGRTPKIRGFKPMGKKPKEKLKKMVYQSAVLEKETKKPENIEIPKGQESGSSDLSITCTEPILATESKPIGLETTDLKKPRASGKPSVFSSDPSKPVQGFLSGQSKNIHVGRFSCSTLSEFRFVLPETTELDLEMKDKQNSKPGNEKMLTSDTLKTQPELKVDTDMEVAHEPLDLQAEGMLSVDTEKTFKLEAEGSLGLESDTVCSPGLRPSACQPDLVSIVTSVSEKQEEKLCSLPSEPSDLPESSSLDTSTEFQSPHSVIETFSQMDKDSTLSATEMPALSYPGKEWVISAAIGPKEMSTQEEGTVDAT